jgi:hypothetical protein
VLRVTVTRESSTDQEPIAEMIIGKVAGSEQRGSYAAHVFEPPSRFSQGADASFALREHERFQPALALVARALDAWRDGKGEEVGEPVRALLRNTRRQAVDLHGDAAPPPMAQDAEDATGQPLDAMAPPSRDLVEALRDLAPEAGPEALAAAAALLGGRHDPALHALAQAVLAVSRRG